ncbi:T9SS type A sorting domain-containing protein [bacterium]|nr:T9SS type A sorting domain-containing protein [bacterium]
MKSLLTSFFLGLLVLGAVPALAADLGAPDSLKLVATRPAAGADDSTFIVEMWLWTDSQAIVGTSIAFEWDNPNVQLDSARGAAGHVQGNPFAIVSYYLLNNIATTNLEQIMLVNTVAFGVPGVPANSTWDKWVTYYFHVDNWTAADSVVFDTVRVGTPYPTVNYQINGGYNAGDEIFPIWLGPLVVKDPSDANDGGDLEVPMNYSLAQNYPNPFNPTTTIGFALPMAGDVRLDVFNLLGQKVKTLVNTEMLAGEHKVVWDGTTDAGTRVASGVYFYRLSTDQFTDTKKMLMLK